MKKGLNLLLTVGVIGAGFLFLVPASGCEQDDYVKRQEVERQEISDPEPVAPGQMIVE